MSETRRRSVRWFLIAGAGWLAGCAGRPFGETMPPETIRLSSDTRLVGFLRHPAWKMRRDAARELSIRPIDAMLLPELDAAKHDCREEVQIWVSVALWRHSGEGEGIPEVVREGVRSCDHEICLNGLEALRRFGPTAASAIHDLTHLTRDEHHPIRRAACLTLAAIGPDAREAVPALAVCADDPFPGVSTAAMYALTSIGQDEAQAALCRKAARDDSWSGEIARRSTPPGEHPLPGKPHRPLGRSGD